LFLLGAGVVGFVGLWLLVSFGTRAISKQILTAADIHSLKAQLANYQKHNHVYPTTEQGLQTLGLVPKDPWSSDYVYRYPGKRYPNAYDLFSAGPDRTAETADDEWGQ
jgi:hypothetical protein